MQGCLERGDVALTNPLELLLSTPDDPSPDYVWATVTSVDPLGIRLDGDATSLAGSPASIIDPATLAVNSRVLILQQRRRRIVIGRSGGTPALPSATLITHGGSDILDPAEWLLAEGQAVSRTAYARLYAAIGTLYGVGDGSTTFNLPDARGRTLVGLSSDTEFDTLGKKFGTKTHTLTTPETPTHSHTTINGGQTVWITSGTGTFPSGSYYGGATLANPITGNAGGGGAHNNIQPSLVARIYIKT